MPAPAPQTTPSAGAPSSTSGAVLARRVVAALIDLALLGAVLVGVYAAGGHHSLAFSPGASLVYSLIQLAYYFAGEATIGRTPGKTLLGLEVVRTDGRRADAGSIAVRTFLRLVDYLPLLYALGFAVALVTPRRQRLGDLFGGTVVVRRVAAR